MDTIELAANDANIFETFDKDSIQRNEDVFSLLSIISHLDYNHTIAIDSKWGGGKTFFIKQCVMILDAHAENVHSDFQSHFEPIRKKCRGKTLPESTLAVYYDAWANDNEQDPLLSILFHIIESQGIGIENDKDWLGIIDTFAGAVSSIVPWSIHLKLKDTVAACKGVDVFEQVKTPRKILELWQKILDKVLASTGADRLVIFIDELDRCRPTFAVRLLERVKHYFIQDSVTCVYAINSSQLQHAIKHEYGAEFDGSKYLERFFNKRISLPAISPDFYLKIHGHTAHYLNFVMIDIISNRFQFSLRDMARYIEQTMSLYESYDKFYSDPYDSELNRMKKYILIPLLVGIRLLGNNEYNNFIDGRSEGLFGEILLPSDNVWFRYVKISDDPTNGDRSKLVSQLYSFFFKPTRSKNNTVQIGQLTVTSYDIDFISWVKQQL